MMGAMTTYGISATLDRDFATAVADVKAALAEQGFGIITEIDMQATLKAKLDVDIAPQVILGACNPGFANRALAAEPSIGLLLPCNVVVRATDAGTVVEMIDTRTMVELAENPAMAEIAGEVGQRLQAALTAVSA
jgi:uncharacterized protein (DUF302 family)